MSHKCMSRFFVKYEKVLAGNLKKMGFAANWVKANYRLKGWFTRDRLKMRFPNEM